MSGSRTAEEVRERRKAWLTMLVVVLIAVAFFAAAWGVSTYLSLRSLSEWD